MVEPSVNLWAVLVSAILFFAFGALWYSPVLFGKAWTRAMGWKRDELESKKEGFNMPLAFGMMFVAGLVMAFVTAHIITFMGVVFPDLTPLQTGLTTVSWLWLGYIATYVISQVAYEKKSWSYYFINTGYWLGGLIITGVVVGLWH